MLDRVRATIARHDLIPAGGRVLVAVSGGRDSMVLLHVLKELGYAVVAGHVDHGLRGAESDADREFVLAHGAAMGVPVLMRRVDLGSPADPTGASLQMRARELRYEALQAMAAEAGAEVIAMAHHADDALETLLLSLLRGTGIKGWASIPVKGRGIIRPLIELSRDDIDRFAADRAILFREDRSNQDPKYLRNRVRHELLPLMDALRPGAGSTGRRSVGLLRELVGLTTDALRAELGEPLRTGGEVPLERIRRSPRPLLAVHWLLQHQDLHPDVLDDLVTAIGTGRHGARFAARDGVIWVERDRLVLAIEPAPTPEVVVSDPRPDPGVPLRFVQGLAPAGPADPRTARFDAARVTFPMLLRRWRPGDRMRPAGMRGSKLVSDILTDGHVDRSARDRALVLESEGRIIWLVGHRVDASAAADGTTKEVLEVHYVEGDSTFPLRSEPNPPPATAPLP